MVKSIIGIIRYSKVTSDKMMFNLYQVTIF